jgi:uncharacterized membrane protein
MFFTILTALSFGGSYILFTKIFNIKRGTSCTGMSFNFGIPTALVIGGFIGLGLDISTFLIK